MIKNKSDISQSKFWTALKSASLILLIFSPIELMARSIIYYCPPPEAFIKKDNKTVAKTKYHDFRFTWIAKDQIPTKYPEYPLTFKGANMVNCKNGLCDLECYYYSDIENHLITSTIQSTNNINIYEYQNQYLSNFNCQHSEHIDCPFILNTY